MIMYTYRRLTRSYVTTNPTFVIYQHHDRYQLKTKTFFFMIMFCNLQVIFLSGRPFMVYLFVSDESRYTRSLFSAATATTPVSLLSVAIQTTFAPVLNKNIYEK